MKSKTNELSVGVNVKKIPATIFGKILAGLIAFLALNASAGVQVTRFDPPLNIAAYADTPDGLLNVLAADFNSDGEADFRLLYGLGDIGAFFNSPTRFGTRVPQPHLTAIGGDVAAVPLNSVIGSNIVSAVRTNYYAWAPGYTNWDDLTQPFGDHQAGVITANLTTWSGTGPVIAFSTNGTLVTNIYYGGPVVSGDVAGKEAVMALEIQVNGQLHYGYIHFDFRSGIAGGIIYGFAYETDPGVPIQALSLAPDKPNRRPEVNNRRWRRAIPLRSGVE